MERLVAATQMPAERVMSYGKRTRLTGMLTYADSSRAGEMPASTCVVLLNAGLVRKVGPGRLNVELARAFSRAGLDSFRFDFASVGDSPARTDGQALGDGIITDIKETLDHLEQTFGYQRFVVMGLCSGADNGMRAAEQDERIVGVAMFDPTIDRTPRWYREAAIAKLRSIRHVKSPLRQLGGVLKRSLGLTSRGREPGDGAGEQPELYQVTYADRASITRCLGTLIARDVRLFITFTGSWDFIYNYETQFLDVYPGIPFADKLELSFRPQADHSFLIRKDREQLMDDLVSWCRLLT